MEIRQIVENKWQVRDLLFLADEQEDMIEKYLDRGELFVCYEGGDAIAVAVVTDEGNDICELQNLAVAPGSQRRGYGKAMVKFLFETYKSHFKTMAVGTGDSPITVPFYEACGFSISHRLENYMLEHYRNPIMENGIQIFDKIVLAKNLKGESASAASN
ncbi:MAG: GNAT family N-acetyltransferase [Oscillospiraceae bacterium]|jgi:ribosomal protein S18 acetylase RimI-like enzyme|nr:GNAT family N-acetyltransferase [Oscillospiraceae bacterium]